MDVNVKGGIGRDEFGDVDRGQSIKGFVLDLILERQRELGEGGQGYLRGWINGLGTR